MELTPNDVEQKAFTQALRGYQMDEVDDFLDEIVATLRASEQRLRDAEEKVRALEVEATTRGGDETTISRAILVAQRSADALLADARGEADRIAREAKAETEILRSERETERRRLQGEIDGMRERVSGVRAALTHLSAAVSGEVVEMETEIEAVAVELQPETVPADGESPGQPLNAPIAAAMDDDAFTPMFDPSVGQVSEEPGEDQAEPRDHSHDDAEVQPSDLNHHEEGPTNDAEGPNHGVGQVSEEPGEDQAEPRDHSHDDAQGQSSDLNHHEDGPTNDAEGPNHGVERAASRVVSRPWERG